MVGTRFAGWPSVLMSFHHGLPLKTKVLGSMIKVCQRRSNSSCGGNLCALGGAFTSKENICRLNAAKAAPLQEVTLLVRSFLSMFPIQLKVHTGHLRAYPVS